MKTSQITGIGEPEPVGKKSLFQPSVDIEIQSNKNLLPKKVEPAKEKPKSTRRVRTTIELTQNAMMIIQYIQNRHRLRTGRVLPLWKLVSRAIEYYGKPETRRSK